MVKLVVFPPNQVKLVVFSKREKRVMAQFRQLYVVRYYIKWVKSFWIYSTICPRINIKGTTIHKTHLYILQYLPSATFRTLAASVNSDWKCKIVCIRVADPAGFYQDPDPDGFYPNRMGFTRIRLGLTWSGSDLREKLAPTHRILPNLLHLLLFSFDIEFIIIDTLLW